MQYQCHYQAQKLESALCKVRRDGKPFEAVYGPPMGCDVTVSQRAHCEEYLVVRSPALCRTRACACVYCHWVPQLLPELSSEALVYFPSALYVSALDVSMWEPVQLALVPFCILSLLTFAPPPPPPLSTPPCLCSRPITLHPAAARWQRCLSSV